MSSRPIQFWRIFPSILMEGNIRQNSMGLYDILIYDYYMFICLLSYIVHACDISCVLLTSACCMMLISSFFLPLACMRLTVFVLMPCLLVHTCFVLVPDCIKRGFRDNIQVNIWEIAVAIRN